MGGGGRWLVNLGNAQRCKKDIEASSESDASTTYVSSLFDSDEIGEL
jgi:hypothetical protein